MKNLEQIRAAHALSAENAAKFDKKVVNKLPALIMNSGLLALPSQFRRRLVVEWA